jgi:hypothetical protein
MLNTTLINRLISLEGVVDAMFKIEAPDVATALKICISDIFSDMIKKHGEDLEKQFASEQEIEGKIKDLSKEKNDENIKQIKEIYDQLKARK